MHLRYSLALISLLNFGVLTNAMERKPAVYGVVEDSLGRSVIVEWTDEKTNLLTKESLSHKKPVKLFDLAKIAMDKKISFQPSGAVGSWLTNTFETTPISLLQEWNRIKNTDYDKLLITLKLTPLGKGSLYYSIFQKEISEGEKVEVSVFDNFPLLNEYPHIKVRLSENYVSSLTDPKQVIVKGINEKFDTSAGDVFRYILNLDETFSKPNRDLIISKNMLNQAYQKLMREWHPDKQQNDFDKKLAGDITKLVTHSYRALDNQLINESKAEEKRLHDAQQIQSQLILDPELDDFKVV